MADRPIISIGLPVYNGGPHLRQAIDSLLAQTFSELELFISDNGSTDETLQVCQEYVRKDPRVKYHRQDINRGVVWNFNRVFEAGQATEFFMWAAHDDRWDPFYIERCLKALKDSEKIVLAGSQCDCIDAQTGQVLFVDPGVTTVGLNPHERFRRYKTLLHGPKNINALFYGVYRRRVLAQVMPLRKELAGDHLLLAKLSLLGEFLTVPENLMAKKNGGVSRSFKSFAGIFQISNPLIARSPYLVREWNLQKIIVRSGQMSFLEKWSLACWSAFHYLILFLKMRYWSIREPIKRFFKKRAQG